MRIVELRVDGQRLKLTSDGSLRQAIVRGDLSPDTLVLISRDADEIFNGPARDDGHLYDLMIEILGLARMEPRLDILAKPELAPETDDIVETLAPVAQRTPGPWSFEETHSAQVDQTRPSQTPVFAPTPRAAPEPFIGPEPVLAEGRLASFKPRPWRHLMARLVDLPIHYGLAYAVGSAGYAWLGVQSGTSLWFVALPLTVVVEALVLSLTSTSAGKALLNIQLTYRGGRLNPFRALMRSWRVLADGLFFYVPILSLKSMVEAYTDLKRNGRSAWDIKGGHGIIYGPIGLVRWIIILGLMAVGIFLSVALVQAIISGLSGA